MTRGCSASLRNVATSTFVPVRDGTLYTTIGKSPSSATARKCASSIRLSGRL
jgi:hypothetical protein